MRKISRSTGMVFLALTLVSCGPNINTIKRMQALEEGVESPTSIEELTTAIGKYQHRIEDIVTADERIGSWYKILASRYLDKKMYGKALENYKFAVEYYPDNHNLYFYIGVCAGYMSKTALDYNATGATDEKDRYLALAESAYLQAIEIHPKYARALYALGVLYVFELNESEKAIPHLLALLDIEKQNFDAMFILGRAYYTLSRLDEAVEIYERIIKSTKDPVQKEKAENNKKQVLEELYGKD